VSDRRIASRYENLRELFQRSVTVRYIAGFQLVTCTAEEDAHVARERMERYGYEILSVETSGAILGYVDRGSLGEGSCAGSEHRLGPPDLVSDSTPILDFFPILKHRLRAFVLQGNRVTGIVSRVRAGRWAEID
jgi:predicted transcriptional regulator